MKRSTHCGIGLTRNNARFSKPVKSLLLNVFGKNSGYVSGIELDEIEEALDGELTRKQILNWLAYQRIREKIHPTK